jgi:HPt (histidine-containing phosphotransfer) domain-containing protein
VLNKFIRDKQPPEVIEAALRLNGRTVQDSAGPVQPDIDPQLVELFLQDANKSIDVLDSIINKNGNYSAEDIRMYIIYTHGIKNALANINKNELSATAFKLEQLGRDNNIESMAAETPDFLNALKDFISTLTPREEETVEEPTSENELLLREKLQEIKAACKDWDKSKARESLAILRKNTWSKQTKELLEKINEQLLHSDFDEIEDEIDKLMQPL